MSRFFICKKVNYLFKLHMLGYLKQFQLPDTVMSTVKYHNHFMSGTLFRIITIIPRNSVVMAVAVAPSNSTGVH